jgi:quinolinate synthase
MKSPRAAFAVALATAASVHAELPVVAVPEWQPFRAQVLRVADALDVIGAPLAPDERRALDAALAEPTAALAAAKVQAILDRHAVLGVLVLGSGIAAVYAKHQSRKLFVELQVLTAERDRLDKSRLLLWGSFCGVHTVFSTAQVRHWRERGYRVLVHPECTVDVVDAADGAGSTKYLWNALQQAKPGDKLAIGTEGHFVRNAQAYGRDHGITVVNLADIPGTSLGCGCATMSRNDPPHLVAMLDLLRRGKAPTLNQVEAGDAVNEGTGHRERLDEASRSELARDARQALETMIRLTEAAGS